MKVIKRLIIYYFFIFTSLSVYSFASNGNNNIRDFKEVFGSFSLEDPSPTQEIRVTSSSVEEFLQEEIENSLNVPVLEPLVYYAVEELNKIKEEYPACYYLLGAGSESKRALEKALEALIEKNKDQEVLFLTPEIGLYMKAFKEITSLWQASFTLGLIHTEMAQQDFKKLCYNFPAYELESIEEFSYLYQKKPPVKAYYLIPLAEYIFNRKNSIVARINSPHLNAYGRTDQLALVINPRSFLTDYWHLSSNIQKLILDLGQGQSPY